MTEIGGGDKFLINKDDEIVGAMMVIHQGEMTWYNKNSNPAVVPVSSALPVQTIAKNTPKPNYYSKIDFLVISIVLLVTFVGVSYAIGSNENEKPGKDFMSLLMIFVMAIFIGYMVIWNVTSALHTPLMSVTNAISGIIVMGAMLLLNPTNSDEIDEGVILGIISVFFASINIFGGFLVTYRMLSMFKTSHSLDN